MSQGTWGWAYVVVGTVLVGLGGSLATLGWNKIRSFDQWRNAIGGVVREIDLNEHMLDGATFLIRKWPTRTELDAFSYESYHSSHVLSLVTSGVLSNETSEDRIVLNALEGYQRAVARFNAALRIVGRNNPGIFIKTDLIHTTDPAVWPTNLDDTLADPFRNLVIAHKAARAALDKSYRWARGAAA
jgi:hypothetical protein